MKTKIAFKYRRAVVLPIVDSENLIENSNGISTALSASMMQIGFIPSKKLMASINQLNEDEAGKLYKELVSVLRKAKGANVRYEPMYPNFPQQVMEASDVELFINAILHYWTFGEWKPDYEKLPREISFEQTTFKEIDVISEEEFSQIFGELLSSNESLSESDKKTIKWFIDNGSDLSVEKEIPFKENLCYVAGLMLEKGKNISNLIKTATDVLRVATALSGGDVSLAKNTKFKSFPRSTRRIFAKILENVASEEDINRHRGKWVRLFHSLHIGEYSEKLFALAKKIRNNEKIETFNGRVQAAINDMDINAATELLVQRPGEFARKIDHLLRLDDQKEDLVLSRFDDVVHKINTRVLLQLLGHLKIRDKNTNKRVVFPKGGTQRATIVRSHLPALSSDVVTRLSYSILDTLIDRFSQLENLGKVWVDQELDNCPLPTQQRSASEGLFQVARGTKLPFGDKGTLRFFIYWIGQDIDLSATLHDEKFNVIEHISYTNLRSAEYQACHSGDIVQAPHGASEFIDITIDDAVKYGARYVVMNVLVYNGPTFAEHKKVYAGWMTRSKPNSNEIYDPKTVEQKIDITADARNCVPVIFDLVERKAIWVDLTTSTRAFYGGNNIESNRASIQETLEAMVNLDNKISLYNLFMLHGQARGEIVDSKEDADVIFSIDEGITPYDISKINSEYLV